MKKESELLEILKAAFNEKKLTQEELKKQKVLVEELKSLVTQLSKEDKIIFYKIEEIINKLNISEINRAIEFMFYLKHDLIKLSN